MNSRVTDVNDNAPMFSSSSYKARVSEATPTGLIFIVILVDFDKFCQNLRHACLSGFIISWAVKKVKPRTLKIYDKIWLDMKNDDIYRIYQSLVKTTVGRSASSFSVAGMMCYQLLATQSSALRISAYRDFQSNPTQSHTHPLIAFGHLSLSIVIRNNASRPRQINVD